VVVFLEASLKRGCQFVVYLNQFARRNSCGVSVLALGVSVSGIGIGLGVSVWGLGVSVLGLQLLLVFNIM
jgi:hypothetical protein